MVIDIHFIDTKFQKTKKNWVACSRDIEVIELTVVKGIFWSRRMNFIWFLNGCKKGKQCFFIFLQVLNMFWEYEKDKT